MSRDHWMKLLGGARSPREALAAASVLSAFCLVVAAGGGSGTIRAADVTASGGPCASPVPGASAPPAGSPSAGASLFPGASAAPPGSPSAEASPFPGASPSAGPSATPQPPDTGGTTTGGDIPDNAVFLRYRDATQGFSIKYVEGWQVTPAADGVLIRDKDSSETVAVVPCIVDIPAYIATTDLPALRSIPDFKLKKQDTVKVGDQKLHHLVYHAPAPPDPVTGKQVPSTVDRYYVPGPTGIAVVTLSTPDGVDNVDAFREMITSFRWR